MLLQRKQLETLEKKNLAPYAIKSSILRGRKYPEKEHEYLLPIQIDRNRIIHSKAFRRLEAKTQVFFPQKGDHYRNRLTHTLEVAQISRDVARNLCVNEDLAEVIALAHDLGHTPFGHAGEEILDKIMKEFKMHFEHNEQSRRVVEKLERNYPGFEGLNLNIEVIEGLMKHETIYDKPSHIVRSATMEAQIVNFADEIAYTSHDIDDGLRSKLITLEELEEISLWKSNIKNVKEKYGDKMSKRVFKERSVSNLTSMMILDLMTATEKLLQKYEINSLGNVYASKSKLVSFSSQFVAKNSELKKFLYKKLYCNPQVLNKHKEGQKIIQVLFKTFYKNPHKLPLSYQKQITDGEKMEVVIKDYIAGMTDNFAYKKYKELC